MDLDTAKRQLTIWNKTLEWIEDNPELFERFVALALEKADKNQTFGISALTERVRWDWPDEAAATVPLWEPGANSSPASSGDGRRRGR